MARPVLLVVSVRYQTPVSASDTVKWAAGAPGRGTLSTSRKRAPEFPDFSVSGLVRGKQIWPNSPPESAAQVNSTQ